jgi:hypothetical protein
MPLKLYHVSDIPGIEIFEPRVITQEGASPDVKVVWAVEDRLVHNFLVPRDCPRVTFYAGPKTTSDDARDVMRSTSANHVVTIESGWLDRMREETLYLYEMPEETFVLYLDDPGPAHYVSAEAVVPRSVTVVNDLLGEMIKRDVEFRVTPSLWPLRDRIIATTIQFSCYRMRNAAPQVFLAEHIGGSRLRSN